MNSLPHETNKMKFLKYNIGIIITAIFMAVMSFQEYRHPRYGKENVPLIYLIISVTLTIMLAIIYFRYFHKKPVKKLASSHKNIPSKPKNRR